MSLSVSQSLEEVDVEKDLKKKEAEGEETSSIVLSEKEDSDSDEEEVNESPDVVDSITVKDSTSDTKNEDKPEKDDDEEEEEEKTNLTSNDNVIISSQSTAQKKDEELEVDSSDDSDEEDYNMRKLEQDMNKDTLLSFHPETKQINYKELLTLSTITRNKKGIIVDRLHTTLPFLTRYEKAKVLGLRAKQINNGSHAFVTVPNRIIDGHIIAKMELNEKKIPFIIRRPMPNGGSEYWKVSDLPVIE